MTTLEVIAGSAMSFLETAIHVSLDFLLFLNPSIDYVPLLPSEIFCTCLYHLNCFLITLIAATSVTNITVI